MLAIDFMDEFAFGAREAAWPLIRQDLKLNYFNVIILFSFPLFYFTRRFY